MNILEKISEKTGITVTKILSKNRQREVCEARYMYVALLSDSGISKIDIARKLGKAHTIILHNLKTHENLMQIDNKYRTLYESMRSELIPAVEKQLTDRELLLEIREMLKELLKKGDK
jgi:chromosomal replication initiation ATPase DnaA